MISGPWSRAGLGRILCLLGLMFGPVATQASGEAITLLQADGETLSLARPADSIITLAPNLAELVFVSDSDNVGTPVLRPSTLAGDATFPIPTGGSS